MPDESSPRDDLTRRTWHLAIFAAVVYFGFAFFYWHFVDWLTPFLAPSLWLPVLVLQALALVVALVVAFRRWRTSGAASLLPLLLCLLVVLCALFVDFTRLWLQTHFFLGRAAREAVVRQIARGELRPNVVRNPGLVRLPQRYRWVSLGGGEVMVEGEKVFFFTFRGILDNFAGFVHTPNDTPPQDGEFAGEFFINERLDEKWYYVSAK